ncbi:MAG TPA: Uma2 family endonuclease [Chloroflexia bacterium]|nr:Uma2 family endonuclease [Chloroflexia bacterium]
MAIQTKPISTEEFERMAEAGLLSKQYREELIRGIIVKKMTPNPPHATCVTRLQYMFILRFGSATATVRVQNPIRIPPNSMPEPDIALLKWRADLYEGMHPSAEEVLLLIEVSDITLDNDRNVKAPLYAEGGIPEYWIVNIQEEVVEVYSDLAEGSYSSVHRVGRGETLTLPQGLSGIVAVDDILG